MKLDRRQVLKYGLLGAVVLANAGFGLSQRGTVRRAPNRPLRVLDEREFAILAALSDRIAPAHGEFPAASDLEVAERIDAFLEGAHPGVQSEFKQLLRLLENALAGLLLDQRLTTFTASSPEVQDRILEGWRTSRLRLRRTGFSALNGLVGATYYGSPETYAAVGYPGPPDFGNVGRDR